MYKWIFSILKAVSPDRIKSGKRKLQHMIDSAGLPLTAEQVAKAITSTDIALTLTLTIFEIYFFIIEGVQSYLDIAVYVSVMWILSFVAFLILLWFGFFFYLDLRKFRLNKELSKIRTIMKTGEEKDLTKKIDPFLWRKSVAEKFAVFFKKKKDDDDDDDYLSKVKLKKVKEERVSRHERLRRLYGYLQKAGFSIDLYYVSKNIFKIVMFLMGLITLYELVYFSMVGADSISYVLAIAGIIWIPLFAVTWIVLWIAFVVYLDIRIFKRRLMVEEVLPDFLQLTSSNIRAGMTIDRALWFAVRPRFGVLANEIEEVAKRTLSGEPLKESLKIFSKRYDSVILHRAIDILIEGIDAGGNVGDLLNKIAVNIQELTSLKKEMSANVTTYVIFIGFATLIAAPVLFGLSNQLLIVVDTIASSLDPTAASGGTFAISVNTEGAINLSDYKWFCRFSLFLTSIFSAMIIATIQKGNIKEKAHYIPVFIVVTQIVFVIASYLLAGMFTGFIG